MSRPLLMCTSIFQDYEPGIVLKDRFKMSREWIREAAGTFNFLVSIGGAIAVDSDGWQILGAGERAGTIMHRDLQVAGIDSSALYPPGNYVLTYTGVGRIIVALDGVPVEKESNNLWAKPASAGRILFTVPQATNAGIYVGIDEEDPGNRIRNVKVFQAEYEGTLEANPWEPAALVDQVPFSDQRVMNWQATNYHPNGTWANRAKLTNARYTTRLGMPLELCIDWANRCGQNLWVCIPHKADNAYVQAMADLVNFSLAAQLGCKVELSNEIWNAQFDFDPGYADWDPSDGQGAYLQTQGLAQSLDANPYQARLKFYSKRAKEVLTLFRNRFSNPSRVTRVLAGHHEGDDANQNLVLDYESASSEAEMFATAPYWGLGGCGALANAQNVIDCMQTSLVGAPTTRIFDHKARASSRGLEYAFYEGGSSPIIPDAAAVIVVKNALYDEQMREQYEALFASCIAAGVDLVGLYSYCTKFGTNGAFGHLRRVGESPRPARWVALENYAAQTTTQPTSPDTDAKVEAMLGYDSSNARWTWFAGPGVGATFSGSAINFLGATYQSQALAADTTFTVVGALRGARLVLELTGAFKVKWPSNFRIRRGRYDGSNGQLNRVAIYCKEHVGTPEFEVEIETLPASQTGLVLRQNLVTADSSTLFGSWAEILSSPSGTPASANRYSRLGDMERFRDRRGFFNFHLLWPLLNGTNGQPMFLKFRQRSSPLEPIGRERVVGYELGDHNLTNAAPYNGLCRTSINEAWLSPVAGFNEVTQPYIAISRHGLAPSLGVGPNLILAPNLVLTSRFELYVE